jgi:hypothetical protein
MELTCDVCGVKENISSMDFMESGQVLEDFISSALFDAVEEGWTVVAGGDFCEECSTEKGLNLGDEGAVV